MEQSQSAGRLMTSRIQCDLVRQDGAIDSIVNPFQHNELSTVNGAIASIVNPFQQMSYLP
jgi:hypothetical protein